MGLESFLKMVDDLQDLVVGDVGLGMEVYQGFEQRHYDDIVDRLPLVELGKADFDDLLIEVA